MPAGDQSDQGLGLPQPASQAEAVILPNCRAGRIGDVTEFASCLVEDSESCPNGFVSGAFHFCVHPQREAIITRTLAAQLPPGS